MSISISIVIFIYLKVQHVFQNIYYIRESLTLNYKNLKPRNITVNRKVIQECVHTFLIKRVYLARVIVVNLSQTAT